MDGEAKGKCDIIFRGNFKLGLQVPFSRALT